MWDAMSLQNPKAGAQMPPDIGIGQSSKAYGPVPGCHAEQRHQREYLQWRALAEIA